MPDYEFIHSWSDVSSVLNYAIDSGFKIRSGAPQRELEPCLVTRDSIASFQGGVFYLFRPEWEFGQCQMLLISEGANKGMYTLSPRVNISPITLYFQGEGLSNDRRRFGAGLLSFHRDWLELPANVVRKTPREVAVWYKKLASHMFSEMLIKVDVHKYHLCKGVLATPNAIQWLPPFEFIPWNGESLARHQG